MAKANKNKKRKMKSLVLLLFLTIVLLTTSTYAWFTANKTVVIDPIDVRVATSTGLQISTDASEWKTLISNTDITSPANWTSQNGNLNQVPSELSPVSTTGAANNGFMKFFKGTVEGNAGGDLALYTEASAAEAYGTSGDFIAFDIFLKLDGASAQPVYLDNNSGVIVTATKADKGLQYAARYAFLYEGRVQSTTESKETYQALYDFVNMEFEDTNDSLKHYYILSGLLRELYEKKKLSLFNDSILLDYLIRKNEEKKQS